MEGSSWWHFRRFGPGRLSDAKLSLESDLAQPIPSSFPIFPDIPETEIRPFLNKAGDLGSFVFIYPSVALRDGRNSIRFAYLIYVYRCW